MDTDSNLERYAQKQREALERAGTKKFHGNIEPRAKLMALHLKLKKPGLKQLLGGNPLSDEDEFNELEQFFRLSKGNAK